SARLRSTIPTARGCADDAPVNGARLHLASRRARGAAMSLDFLSADLTQPHSGDEPLRRSPVRSVLNDAGAKFETRCGWEVAASFGEPVEEEQACLQTVGIGDRSSLGKLELQGPLQTLDRLASELGGERPPPGQAAERDGLWWCPLRPDRLLVLVPPESTPTIRARLQDAAKPGDGSASVVDLTGSLGSNSVVGPLARETFARVSALDLRPGETEPGRFMPGSVARVPGMVLSQSANRYLHLFGAAYAEYIWTAFIDAAEALGGRAVGANALAAVDAESGANAVA
ncbi:MAG: hypothetical protein ACR2N5_03205, partial [Solirubrobacterales bacterium]